MKNTWITDNVFPMHADKAHSPANYPGVSVQVLVRLASGDKALAFYDFYEKVWYVSSLSFVQGASDNPVVGWQYIPE